MCNGEDHYSIIIDAVVDDIGEVTEECRTHPVGDLGVHLWHPSDAVYLLTDGAGEAISQPFEMLLVLRVGRDDVILGPREVDDRCGHDFRPSRASICSQVRTLTGFA